VGRVKLEPFVRVDDTPFTALALDIRRAHGAPSKSGRNDVGLHELDYGDVVFRFQDSGRLEEITMEARVVTIGKVSVPFHSLAGFIREQDPHVFERAGFVVSPALGLAFDPSEPYWVTAIARHCLPEWEAL